MRAMLHKATTSHPPLFTVLEAAWASQTEDSFVNREVDKKVVQINFNGRRLLARWDIHYLYVVKDFAASINVDLRKRLYVAVREAIESGNRKELSFGPFVLRLNAVSTLVNRRVADIDAARDLVHQNPGIRSGEPVIRGTRILIRMLGEMNRRGASISDLAREYDLPKRQVELALLYDRLHPHRGRPSTNSKDVGFAGLGEIERSEIEELGEYPSRDLSASG